MEFVKILGCGDAFGNRGMLNTCFILETSKAKYAIDFGATSLPALKAMQLDTNDIDGIIISHFHGDHYGGVPNFIMDAYLIQKREKPLWIVCPPGGEERLKLLCSELYREIYQHLENLDIRFLYFQSGEKLPVNDGDIEVEAFPVIHSQDCSPHGFRITTNNKVFAFSGDTEWTDQLYNISADADVFICESNYFDNKGPGHLRYIDILNNRNKFSCERLYISHLGEDWTEDNIENAELSILKDGDIISF